MNDESPPVSEIEAADPILDDLFHACAFEAFIERAVIERATPRPESTRRRAYELYEQSLRHKHEPASPNP
jgi:hypothetical protein